MMALIEGPQRWVLCLDCETISNERRHKCSKRAGGPLVSLSTILNRTSDPSGCALGAQVISEVAPRRKCKVPGRLRLSVTLFLFQSLSRRVALTVRYDLFNMDRR
jgi:hypothetical protein